MAGQISYGTGTKEIDDAIFESFVHALLKQMRLLDPEGTKTLERALAEKRLDLPGPIGLIQTAFKRARHDSKRSQSTGTAIYPSLEELFEELAVKVPEFEADFPKKQRAIAKIERTVSNRLAGVITQQEFARTFYEILVTLWDSGSHEVYEECLRTVPKRLWNELDVPIRSALEIGRDDNQNSTFHTLYARAHRVVQELVQNARQGPTCE